MTRRNLKTKKSREFWAFVDEITKNIKADNNRFDMRKYETGKEIHASLLKGYSNEI